MNQCFSICTTFHGLTDTLINFAKLHLYSFPVLRKTSTVIPTVVQQETKLSRLASGAIRFEYRLFTFYVEPQSNHM